MCVDPTHNKTFQQALPHLEANKPRVLALGLLEDGARLRPHVRALLHSHQENVCVVALSRTRVVSK